MVAYASYLRSYATPHFQQGRKSAEKNEPKVPVSKRVNESVRTDGIGHWIVAAEGKLVCGKCGGRSTRKCEKCNVGLHDLCFKDFHQK
jgi:hypothetical protein